MNGRRLRAAVVSVVAVGSVVGVVACGDDDSASTTVPTTTVPPSTTNPGPVSAPSEELCQAVDQLKTSISDLSNINVLKNGTSAVTDAVTKIKDDLGAVKSAAGSDVQPQVDAFQRALDQLQTALTSSGTPQVAAVVSGIQNVATTGATLLSSLGNLKCS